ncbi:MAG: SpoIIE family protein phosphatase [Bacteroidia bacterium]|nr:SpoIIE family protein phosphatase [Bacteroidia bacterium]MDW8158170.1 SpoIIE family protein phosphatase [Bacteroidia bacterium]
MIVTAERINILKNIEIFQGIPDSVISFLADHLIEIHVNDGDLIFEKGSTGDCMYIIFQGRVKIHSEDITLAELNSGDFFGEFSLIDNAPRSASVTAIQNGTILLQLNQDDFFVLLSMQVEVSKKILQTIIQRLRKQNEKNIQMQKQKQEELQALVDERTRELQQAFKVIEHKNEEIMDSIKYARRIQEAILPSKEELFSVFPDSFILYKPRDIVSGDFYWIGQVKNRFIITAADCTGHGVPGAFMSVMGSSLLNQIVNEKGIVEPAQILNMLNISIQVNLHQIDADSNSKDGMDMALLSFDLSVPQVYYAGANNPLYMVRNNELVEYKPNKFPIGGGQYKESDFTQHCIELQVGDALYIFSDGYADQFGGPKGKKFMYKHLKQVLLEIQNLSMPEQGDKLNKIFEEWKGDRPQIDDIVFIGMRLTK